MCKLFEENNIVIDESETFKLELLAKKGMPQIADSDRNLKFLRYVMEEAKKHGFESNPRIRALQDGYASKP